MHNIILCMSTKIKIPEKIKKDLFAEIFEATINTCCKTQNFSIILPCSVHEQKEAMTSFT